MRPAAVYPMVFDNDGRLTPHPNALFYDNDGNLVKWGQQQEQTDLTQQYLISMADMITDEMLLETEMTNQQRNFAELGGMVISTQNCRMSVRLGEMGPYVVGNMNTDLSLISFGDQWIHKWIAEHE